MRGGLLAQIFFQEVFTSRDSRLQATCVIAAARTTRLETDAADLTPQEKEERRREEKRAVSQSRDAARRFRPYRLEN